MGGLTFFLLHYIKLRMPLNQNPKGRWAIANVVCPLAPFDTMNNSFVCPFHYIIGIFCMSFSTTLNITNNSESDLFIPCMLKFMAKPT
jgi:hypothetical protein